MCPHIKQYKFKVQITSFIKKFKRHYLIGMMNEYKTEYYNENVNIKMKIIHQ